MSEVQLAGATTRSDEISLVGVLISAPDEESYAAWLPIARAYVGTFVFEGDANR